MSATPLRKTSFDYEGWLRDAPGCLKLQTRQLEKPWGRFDVPRLFGNWADRRIGEVWFEHPEADDPALLVKYLFTSEKLSVQVHPDDRQARERGLSRGKSECWYVLDAEPGARIGLGLRSPLPPAELREAALDGSIEELLEWKPVAPGDFFYVPAGTIHALGAGLTVLEIQQNSDATYRLYDYGRPRELHLEDGIAVSEAGSYSGHWSRRAGGLVDAVLHNGPHFCLVRASSSDAIPESLSNRPRWIMPLEGRAWSNGESGSSGECLLLQPGAELSMSQDCVVLVAAEGSI